MAGTLDQSNSAQSLDGNGIRFAASNGNFKAAVQFTPSITGDLSQVDFCLGFVTANPAGGGNIWAELWSDNGSNLPNAIIGSASTTQLASAVNTNWNVGGNGHGGAIFQFVWPSGSEPGTLTSGTKYWVVFNGDYPTTGGTNQIAIMNITASPPLSYLQEDAGWTTSIGGLWFKEYYVPHVNKGGSFLLNFV